VFERGVERATGIEPV